MKKVLAFLIVFMLVVSPLMVTAADQSIVDIAVGDEQFSILVQALTKAGLVETLKGEGPFTVFAPTNAAFEALLKELNITAEELLAREDLKDILLYHVVSGKVMSTDLTDGMMPKTVQGSTLKIDLSNGVMINESKVAKADIEASNGVIHVIDKVLLPSSDEAMPEAVPQTGSLGMLPFISAALVSGLGYVALKRKK
nr:fasciclin domain-containing protein [Tissierella sp.]